MKKKMLVGGIITLVAIILIPVAMMAINPLRMPSKLVKMSILKITPIGTSMEDVIDVVRSNEKWEGCLVNYDGRDANGFLSKECKRSIRSSVGDYGIITNGYNNFFSTNVTVLWGFDKDFKLIDVYVWKTIG